MRLIVLVALLLLPLAARADLAGYVKKPDSVFGWETTETFRSPLGTVYRLKVTSQTWQGIVWTHSLCIYQPANILPGETMALLNTGGSPNATTDGLGMELAKRAEAPVAVLYDVPNQPLLGDKREDALIAETFLRYMKTGDDSWPLLLPMVKSVVRAMDVVQAFAKKEWKRDIRTFVITGASKRGWTSWLTAAAGDKRVKAIAPMVIDTLNMPAQLTHQRQSYGTLSEEINDYSSAGLTEAFATPRGKTLVGLIDPYSYRTMLTLPKLIINGANDPYWTVDALRLYWNELPGQKWVSYVPNAGHNLIEKKPDGTQSPERLLAVLSAFIRSQSGGATMPTFQITEANGEQGYVLKVQANPAPRMARLWVARSTTRDFRKTTWEVAQILDTSGGKNRMEFRVRPRTEGYAACFAEMEYELNKQTFTLSTPVWVVTKNNTAPIAGATAGR